MVVPNDGSSALADTMAEQMRSIAGRAVQRVADIGTLVEVDGVLHLQLNSMQAGVTVPPSLFGFAAKYREGYGTEAEPHLDGHAHTDPQGGTTGNTQHQHYSNLDATKLHRHVNYIPVAGDTGLCVYAGGRWWFTELL